MFESILLELVIVLASNTVVATLFHSLRIPTIVGFILTGVLIGPYSLRLVGSVPGARSLTEFAILFLMFTLGLEFSPRKVIRLKRPFLGVGLVQLVATHALASAAAYFLFRLPAGKSLFVGALVAMSSTAIVMKLLEDARELHSPFGEACLGALLFQDIAVIPLTLAIPLMAMGPEIAGTQWTRLAAAPLVLVGIWLGGRFAVPWVFGRILKTRSREIFFFAVLSLCLGIATGVHALGLSLSFGAFLAGLILSDTPYVKQIAADIIHLRDNFLGLFFTSLGMLLDPSFVLAHPLVVIGLAVSLVLGKAAVTYGAARFAGYAASAAGIVALLLAQVGEFSFVMATQGLQMHIITPGDLQYFLSASLLSILATPFLFKSAPRWFTQARTTILPIGEEARRASSGGPAIVILGFGPVGRDVAQALKAMGVPYRITEMNPDIVREYKAKGEDILYGDATQEAILDAAGIGHCRLVVLSVSGPTMTRATLDAIRRARPDVPVIVRVQYLRELEDLTLDENAEAVVAEFETSVEMLVRTLGAYGIGRADVARLVQDLRGRLKSRAASLWSGAEMMRLPSWETISRIRPIRVAEDSDVVGRSLAELRLRETYGANVVCVFRRGLGTTIPKGDFVLEAGDVLHLIGSEASLASAEDGLSGNLRG